MQLIDQSHIVVKFPEDILKDMERAARVCYQSEGAITPESAPVLIRKLLKKKHEAMIEFGDIWISLITNRGVTHELVRHRMGVSYAQESTRYCVYIEDSLLFIKPVWWENSSEEQKELFTATCIMAEKTYIQLLKSGWSAQKAREVLPNSLKTQILVKANIREWRHILNLRCSNAAHPQMKALMRNVLKELYGRCPLLFEDLYEKYIMKGKMLN